MMTTDTVHVYPVGLLADLRHLWQRIRRHPWRTLKHLRRFANQLPARWGRRNYWNGFLAEPETERYGHCGHGWTQRRAQRSLEHIKATTHWARHITCGTVRKTADVPRRFCVICNESSSPSTWVRVDSFCGVRC